MFNRRLSHVSHLPRYREVANVLIKHGFGFIFDRFTFYRLKRTTGKNGMSENMRSPNAAYHLRLAFQELGPTFIKLGQLLSVRPDLLRSEYIEEFERLQDNVPPFGYSEVAQVCQEEGIIIEEIFSIFDTAPIAAASMGQVHEAYLKTGERVVVKVQRPGIEPQVETDLEIMLELAHLLERRTSWGRLYKISEIVEELGQALRNELDFHKEARNASVFYKNFRNNPHVLIPRVFWQYSTRRVLTLEYLEGVKISDIAGLKKANYNPERIVAHLVEALFKQVYEHGIFHADPHPGNIAVAEGEVVVFYDFGQVGVVDEQVREKYVNMLIGMMRYDTHAVTRAILDIGITNQRINREELRRDVARLQQKYYGMPLSEINVGEALFELIDLSMKYQMRLPAELSLLAKMVMTVEAMVSKLDPQLSIIDMAEPYGRRALLKKFNPTHAQESLRNLFLDYVSIARSFPRDLDTILKLISDGELKIKMEHSNLRRLSSRIDILSNRLSLAIILASIIVGSSLVVDNANSNILGRIPLAEVGFVSALILGLFLVYSIIRSGRY